MYFTDDSLLPENPGRAAPQSLSNGRVGNPEEYAALAVHFASDENYCVGQIISPNGGLFI